jgi:peptidoglycan/LPS O-acetylase OafA/YrhL
MHDRSAARDITTVMMSAIGVTSIVPGRILYALGTQRGLVVLMGIQMALLLSFGCLVAFGDETTFYAGFGLMYAWRVWGFGIAFPFIDWRFRQFGKGVGVCYGAVYGIGGGVSAIAGLIASSILHSHPQSATRPLVGALCAIAVVVELSFGIAIARTKGADMAHPPSEEERDGAAVPHANA